MIPDPDIVVPEDAELSKRRIRRRGHHVLETIVDTVVECRKAGVPDPQALEVVDTGVVPAGGTVYTALGCAACNQSGYRGRTGIYEMLTVDDGLRQLIHARTAQQQLRDYAVAHGMRPLRQDGWRWVVQGVTSPEELARVTGE